MSTSPLPSFPWTPVSAYEKHEERIFETLQYITELTTDRSVQSANSQRARECLIQQLIRVGIRQIEEQSFEFKHKDQLCTGTNVIGICKIGKKETNESLLPCFLLSAHYDTIQHCPGFDDNGSGLATVLRIVELFNAAHTQIEQSFLLIVAFFDAEELGLHGSTAFVRQPPSLVKQWINPARMKLVCNIDSILMGDDLCFYTSKGENGQLFPHITTLYKENVRKGIFQSDAELTTSPAMFQKKRVHGQTVPFSDHHPFEAIMNIPVCHIEATSWKAGKKDGFTQSEQFGSFWDTPKDTLKDTLQARGKEWLTKMKHRLGTVSILVTLIIGEILQESVSNV